MNRTPRRAAPAQEPPPPRIFDGPRASQGPGRPTCERSSGGRGTVPSACGLGRLLVPEPSLGYRDKPVWAIDASARSGRSARLALRHRAGTIRHPALAGDLVARRVLLLVVPDPAHLDGPEVRGSPCRGGRSSIGVLRW